MATNVSVRRRILVTGATGKQGGAVVKALVDLNNKIAEFEILALTRNTSSAAAKALTRLENVRLINGDQNHAVDIFEQAGGVGAIWGVFSVQVPDSKTDAYSDDNKEYRQGASLIDASLQYGVHHFVQTSVDRGGAQSYNNPTPIPHFITKHRIERHLKAKAKDSKMSYTILRPTAFMDMLAPGMGGRIFAAAIGRLGDKPLQFVHVKDIGIFAAQAFASPNTDEYENKSISLAGDELTLDGIKEIFWQTFHRPMPVGYDFNVSLLFWFIPEVDTMFNWFKVVGYGVDIEKCRKLNSKMSDMATYLREESGFKQ